MNWQRELWKAEFLRMTTYHLFKMRRKFLCPICGRTLMESEIEGYSFQCLYCDEDFTLSEAVIKTEEDEKDKQ